MNEVFRAYLIDDSGATAPVVLPCDDLDGAAKAAGLGAGYRLLTDFDGWEKVNSIAGLSLGSQFGAAVEYSDELDEELTDDVFKIVFDRGRTGLDELNEAAEAVASWDAEERRAARLLCSAGLIDNLDDLLELMRDGDYSIWGASTDSELGELIIEDYPPYCDAPEELKRYLDAESIGRDYRLESTGDYIERVYIERR